MSALTYTVLSAILFPLALPNELFPLGSALLGTVALVPLYLAFCRTTHTRTAVRLGIVFGALSTIIGNYWLVFYEDYSLWTIGGTTLGYVGYNLVLAGFLWVTTRAHESYRPILFALAWTAYEYFKSIGFLGYPWGLAGYPFSSVLVISQLSAITGVWGISFLAVYANTALAEVLTARSFHAPAYRHLAMVALLVVASTVYGSIQMRSLPPTNESLQLVLVQQNADAWNTDNVARPLRISQEETKAALARSDAPDLVVWSETALRYLFPQGWSWYERNPPEEPFVEFLAGLPVPLLTGAPYQNPDDETAIHNATLLFSEEAEILQWYGKQHLVPFAEAIPFFEHEAVRRFFREAVGLTGTWAPGPSARLFTVESDSGRPVSIATPICFEDGFAYVNRYFVRAGADVLLNLTNNSWSRTNSAQTQHFVAARYRAIESNRGLVRSTNSGYTAVIDPRGRLVDSLPMFETSSLVVDVPVYRPERETFYQTYGDYLPLAMIAVLGSLLIRSKIRERKEP